MCPIKIEEIRIDHIIDFAKDNTTFAAARENGNNHLRIFLINNNNGTVYTRNGRADNWEELYGYLKEVVVERIISSRYDSVPVYKINGAHNN